MSVGEPLEVRFWARVDKTETCWLWTGANSGREGYGKIYAHGRMDYAHRVSYELFVGPIPAGLQIDHLCRTHACVNPDHLEPVTHRENGYRGSRTRLTDEDVAAIRASSDGTSSVARQYGISKTHVLHIRNGQRRAAA